MSLITWSDKYSVNVPALDEQHLNLIKIINKFHDAMKAGKGKQELGSVLHELISYTKYHFTFEEKLMKDSSFNEFSSHRREHEEFTKKVIKFQADYENGTTLITVELMNFLKQWLLDHILISDKKYSHVIK